jgi:RNA recognition motif-containing protein
MAVLLIIDHLPVDFSDQDLIALFRPFATAHNCRIVRDRSGTSLGFGFAELESSEEASRAVAVLDRMQLRNQIIRVGPVKDFPTRSQ